MSAQPPLAESILAGRTIDGPMSARVSIDGREYINFLGSGYLALSNIPEVRAAVLQVLAAGAPFARAISSIAESIDPVFDAVERAAAVACGTEASVYFASGYLIGAVGLARLDQSCDVLLLDESAHYNLKDAAKLTGLPAFEFAHCDPESLRDVLRQRVHARQRPWVVTDGVFATTGRVPPLADYAGALASCNGRLFIDESHGFGVVGTRGRGAAEYCGVEHLAATGATLSKAFCAQGAIVGCSAATARRLRLIPPVRGANAGSPLSAAAATASLKFVADHPQLRVNLRVMTDYLRGRLRSAGFDVIDSPAPIVAFQLPTRSDMLALQRRLFDRRIHVQYSTYIGAGAKGMMRCAVFADHSQEDIDTLIDALG